MRQITTPLVLLLTLFVLAGCGKSAAQKRSELKMQLRGAWFVYMGYESEHHEGPPNWDKFLEHAEKSVADSGGKADGVKTLKNLRDEGFEFTWSVKTKEINDRLSKTVMAESSKYKFKLMFDGAVSKNP